MSACTHNHTGHDHHDHDHGPHEHNHTPKDKHDHHDHGSHEGHAHANFTPKGMAIIFGAAAVLSFIGDLTSLSGARQRGAEKVVTAAVQSAVDKGDCGLSSVLGRTLSYNSKDDTMNLFRRAGTVTVGQELDGFVKKTDTGTITYRVQLKDNVNGRSSGDKSGFSGETDDNFGKITVTGRACLNRNLAMLIH